MHARRAQTIVSEMREHEGKRVRTHVLSPTFWHFNISTQTKKVFNALMDESYNLKPR